MKILAVTPTYWSNGKLEMEDECLEGVFRQHLDGHLLDWMVSTGPEVESFEEKTVYQDIAYNNVKELVMKEYDCLMTLESDIIMKDKDVVQKMADFLVSHSDADIVTAPHRARPHGVGHSHVVLFSQYYGRVWYNIDNKILNRYYKNLKWGVPFQVAGSGLGCVMLRKHVLEKITFGGNEKINIAGSDVTTGIDTQFFTDCMTQGFKTYCIQVTIGHKDTDGVIYYLDDKFYEDWIDKNVLGQLLKELLMSDEK